MKLDRHEPEGQSEVARADKPGLTKYLNATELGFGSVRDPLSPALAQSLRVRPSAMKGAGCSRCCVRAQDLRINQGLTFLTDGGDSVRSFLDGISPCAENYLDWFHLTMRLTVLSQYTKGLAQHNPVEALALHSRLDRIKWRLWHGDTDVALSRARELAAAVAVLNSDYPGLQRFAKAAAGLVTYIDNNAAAIPDYGERRRYAEPISTAFRLHRQPRGRQALRQEAADAMVKDRRPLAPANPHPDPRQHSAGNVQKMVPAMAANDAQMPAVAA